MPKKSIVLVDRSASISLALLKKIEKKWGRVIQAPALDGPEERPGRSPGDVVLLCADAFTEQEASFAGLQGGPAGAVIFLARNPSLPEAVSAFRAGVLDYLEAPFSAKQLDAALEAALRRDDGDNGSEGVAGPEKGRACIIGKSKKMEKVFALIQKVSDTDTTVLIYGESGTGKELIAQALHHDGARRNGPFVAVNCGAIPAELLESELFGHEKGAFTHAIRTRMGRFELAHGGTVFLDEISEMSPMLQVKILRVLQERQFERIGGARTIRSDFRVIAATNRDLEEEVREGRFREDLYYRLNVIPIVAPPLRERVTDIPLLFDHFMARFNRAGRKKITGMSPEAMTHLLHYAWPGNVRELENTVERMVILAAGKELTVDDLPERILAGGPAKEGMAEEIPELGFFLNEVLADFEKKLIVQALDQTNWVKNRAAKLLNVNRTTLLEKMKRFKLMKPASA